MNFADIDYTEISFRAVIFFFMYFFFYRRYIYSLFDPLFLYVFTLSFSSVLVVDFLSDSKLPYVYHFFWCNLFFFLGFYLAMPKTSFNNEKLKPKYSSSHFPDYNTFRIVLYILIAVYFFSNAVLLYTKGFALLSDNPSESRVENFTKGFGIFARINTSIGTFVMAGLMFRLFTKRTYIDISLLFLCIILTSLSGAKSAFVAVIVIFSFLSNHSLFSHNIKVSSLKKYVIPVGLLGALAIAFVVFSKESSDTEQAIQKFVGRLLMGADSVMYFYLPTNQDYFSQFSFWQYPSYLFNSILVLFRLVDGIEANGNMMVLNVILNPFLIFSGPNTPYYIEGQIYFGYYGAFLYSTTLGYVFAFFRRNYFYSQFHSVFGFVLMMCIADMATLMVIEASMSLTKIFEVCFFTIPVYVAVNFLAYKKVRWRRIRFSKFYSTISE